VLCRALQGKRFKLVTTLGAPVTDSVADGVRMAQEIGDLGIDVQLVADTGAGYHMERSVPHSYRVWERSGAALAHGLGAVRCHISSRFGSGQAPRHLAVWVTTTQGHHHGITSVGGVVLILCCT
jgi:hypothetical protein